MQITTIRDFEGDLTVVTLYTNTPVMMSNKISGHTFNVYYRVGAYNKNGKEVIPCIHYQVKINEDFIEVVTTRGETQYFDKSGNRIRR